MKNKIELKTRKVLSIDKENECAQCQIQFVICFVLAIDELFSL